MAAPIRALVVDDDALARQRVCDLLGAYSDVVTVGECGDGRAAVTALRESPVDLVLLDVEMPGLDGFGVIAEVGPEHLPAVVFISAYSAYAVRAFEAYALDYLLKPFDEARFATTLHRARAQVDARRQASAGSHSNGSAASSPVLDERLQGLLAHVDRRHLMHYPEAIAIKSGDQYVVVRVADIDWFEADGNYSRLYVRGRARLLTKTLATLEHELLDPATFVRVHRSAIVNTSRIASAEPHFHGELTLVLHDGTRVPCSRRHRKALEEKLYFTT